jgi:hypothetical protein
VAELGLINRAQCSGTLLEKVKVVEESGNIPAETAYKQQHF